MVAISLYRGNLHRVTDAPRRWLMPTPKISIKDFKLLLNRRSKALSLLRSSSSTSNPNPNPVSDSKLKQEEDEEEEDSKDNVLTNDDPQLPQLDPTKKDSSSVEVKDQNGSDGADGFAKPVDTAHDSEIVVAEDTSNPIEAIGDLQENPVAPENPKKEICETKNETDASTDKEKRKREVEDKLQILNAKKHNLVQVLKQILNAEEELNRRNSMQGVAGRPSVPLQVDVTNDFGSMTRQATPRMGSDGNLGGDTEVGEADDMSKENTHSRHLLRMSSTSPSSDSPHRRPAYFQHNAVPRPSRASLAVSGSPSRFAPAGHSHPANLPTVSVSGTNYIASSPSPAASGGTSAFRDARLPSPWN